MTPDEAAIELARLILECAAEADRLPPEYEDLRQKLTALRERVKRQPQALTPERVSEALRQHEWVFAKTMANNPHEYTLRAGWRDDALFDAVVLSIRRLGYQSRFGGRAYTYFDFDGYCCWTMGNPVSETTLINRKKLAGYMPDEVQALLEKCKRRDAERKHGALRG